MASEPITIQPAKMGGASGYIISCSSHRNSDFFEGSNQGVQFIAWLRTQYSFPYLISFPQAWYTLSVRVIHMQGGDLHVLQWRRGICNKSEKFALFFVSADRHRMAAGMTESASWALQKVLVRLLRRFNGGSRRQRRVSGEGSSSLKRKNLSCVG